MTVEVSRISRSDGLASCDGRRTFPLAAGGRMDVTIGHQPVNLVRFGAQPFAARLVRKFSLPVRSWREQAPSGDG